MDLALIYVHYWCNHLLESEQPEIWGISVAASILLGKPTHNAFQEWVTYTDTNLEKRLKATSFEMIVLRAVNNNSMGKFQDPIDAINKSFAESVLDPKLKLKELEQVKTITRHVGNY